RRGGTHMNTVDPSRPIPAAGGASARIGPSVQVKGEINGSEDLEIHGSVKGNLKAKDRIEIKKDGSVVGDLSTARIMIEDGAYFKGSIEIEKGAEAARTIKAQPAHAG